MPTTANVKLGRDQTLSLGGTALDGVRELDVDLEMKTFDVTSYEHNVASTLPLLIDATIRILIYWGTTYDTLKAKLNTHPVDPIDLAVSNGPTIRCVPVKVTIKQPIDGVLAWEVSLKPFYAA